MKLIPISGKAGHGKDTFAGMLKTSLKNRGYKILVFHYGDLVKFVAEKFFGWDGKKDEKGRTLLQHVGTEGVRSKDPDYWVRFVLQILTFFPAEWDYVLIPDARFPNEIGGLREAGYSVLHVRIIRPGYNMLTEEQQKHSSETSLDEYPVDLVVINSGTIDDLQKTAEEISAKIVMEE